MNLKNPSARHKRGVQGAGTNGGNASEVRQGKRAGLIERVQDGLVPGADKVGRPSSGGGRHHWTRTGGPQPKSQSKGCLSQASRRTEVGGNGRSETSSILTSSSSIFSSSFIPSGSSRLRRISGSFFSSISTWSFLSSQLNTFSLSISLAIAPFLSIAFFESPIVRSHLILHLPQKRFFFSFANPCFQSKQKCSCRF